MTREYNSNYSLNLISKYLPEHRLVNDSVQTKVYENRPRNIKYLTIYVLFNLKHSLSVMK
jgi:hypothetical protein